MKAGFICLYLVVIMGIKSYAHDDDLIIMDESNDYLSDPKQEYIHRYQSVYSEVSEILFTGFFPPGHEIIYTSEQYANRIHWFITDRLNDLQQIHHDENFEKD